MKTITQQLNIKDFPLVINDKNGNRTYYEDSGGFWYKHEFDKDSNRTYYEDSGGYWYKKEYDENGNRTYYENSGGFWFKREYDKNCKETYFENSYGLIKDKRSTELTLQEFADKAWNRRKEPQD